MAAHLPTPSKTSAFGPIAPALALARGPIAACGQGETAEQMSHGRNARDVDALVARCLR